MLRDVADTFIECLLSPLEGAHVFNLAGEVIHMDAFHRTPVDLDARAKDLVTISGPQVPVAFRMDDSQLRAKIGNLPKTPAPARCRRDVRTISAIEKKRWLNAL